MHETEPSCSAPFGHRMLSGTAVPSFDVATSRRASMFEKSTGYFGDRSASSVVLPDFGENRIQVAGVTYEPITSRMSPRHATGLLALDTGGPTGPLSGLPAR